LAAKGKTKSDPDAGQLFYSTIRKRCGTFHNLIEFGYPQAPHDFLLLLRIADRAFIVLDLDYCAVSFFSFLCHFFIFSMFDFQSAFARANDVLGASADEARIGIANRKLQ
jgi:hypothetical protein